MLPATACWRKRHRQPVVRLSRRILSASQTLKVRPQPGRALRLLQKIRRARSDLAPGAAVVKAEQKAVPNQRADDLAVRTGRQLEPFGNGVPFLVAAVKPALLAHVARLRENRDCTGMGEERGMAGYDKNP